MLNAAPETGISALGPRVDALANQLMGLGDTSRNSIYMGPKTQAAMSAMAAAESGMSFVAAGLNPEQVAEMKALAEKVKLHQDQQGLDGVNAPVSSFSGNRLDTGFRPSAPSLADRGYSPSSPSLS